MNIKKWIMNYFRKNVKHFLVQRSMRKMNKISETSSKMGISEKQSEPRLIVSLTSYGERVKTVYLAIETLFQQTKKADKIILWLNQDNWNDENIPDTLKRAQKRGLEVRFCKDIKSYTKLIPTLVEYPDDIIITFDDDLLYSPNIIKRLYNAYLKQPDLIHCMRAHRICFHYNGAVKSYKDWDFSINKGKVIEPSLDILPTGVGGVLYPPGCFHEDMTNEKLFMELCPTADDIWFRAMSLLKGVKVNVIKNDYKLMIIEDSQETALWQVNYFADKNDECIEKVFNYYNLRDKFKPVSV